MLTGLGQAKCKMAPTNQSTRQPTNQPNLTNKQKETKTEHVENTQKPVLKELLAAKASVELKPKV